MNDFHKRLNLLTAERVMGWDRENEANNSKLNPAFFRDGFWWYGHGGAWSPSTEIGHAWLVVDRMLHMGWRFYLDYQTGLAQAQFRTINLWFDTSEGTAPEAICKAALAARAP